MNPNQRPWTVREIETLRSMRLRGASIAAIGAKLGRSINACIVAAARNGIRLPKKFYKRPARRAAAKQAALPRVVNAVVSTELVPYARAPWAPRVDGARWAYRITTPSGNTAVAASARPRVQVEAEMRQAAERLGECYARYTIGRNGYLTKAGTTA